MMPLELDEPEPEPEPEFDNPDVVEIVVVVVVTDPDESELVCWIRMHCPLGVSTKLGKQAIQNPVIRL